MPNHHLVNVRIIATVPTAELAPEDRELPSEVPVHVAADVPASQIADAALDIFHDNMAVECLDDFRFEVWQDGVQLDPNRDHEGYSLADRGDLA